MVEREQGMPFLSFSFSKPLTPLSLSSRRPLLSLPFPSFPALSPPTFALPASKPVLESEMHRAKLRYCISLINTTFVLIP